MADRVVVMNKGRIEQFGPPEENLHPSQDSFRGRVRWQQQTSSTAKVIDVRDGLIMVQCCRCDHQRRIR